MLEQQHGNSCDKYIWNVGATEYTHVYTYYPLQYNGDFQTKDTWQLRAVTNPGSDIPEKGMYHADASTGHKRFLLQMRFNILGVLEGCTIGGDEGEEGKSAQKELYHAEDGGGSSPSLFWQSADALVFVLYLLFSIKSFLFVT